MLEITNVSKSFGKKQVLNRVSLTLRAGECFGLLGPNGAGKTTLINLITGFHRPDSGSIVLFGEELHGKNNRKIKKRIGLVPQEAALYENLSVFDNLKYFGELYGLGGSSLTGRIHELLHWIGLHDRAHDKVKVLSGGMKRRLNLAGGLLHSPELLLVDEPTVGVDPQGRVFIYELVSQLKENGTTLLYTTHYIPEVERLCDRMAILNAGQFSAAGTLEEIIGKSGIPRMDLESAFFELTGMEIRD